MPISVTLQEFTKAHAIKQLENLVLDRLAPRQERAETGNIVLNECLAEALRARYSIEFLQKDSAALVKDAEAGKPLPFRAVPEYNPAFYLLGRECEQLMHQYVAEWNELQLEIPEILRKIDNAQAAQERALGELRSLPANGNGNRTNVAEKTKRETKETDLKARVANYDKQIEGWRADRAKAEQQLSDLPKTAQRLSQVAGTLAKNIPSGVRFTTEIARYGITPVTMSGKLYCDVHEKISLPGTLADILEISLPSAEPKVNRRSTVKIMAAVTAGIVGLVGGIAVFNRPPGVLQEGKDYVVDARESGWAPVKTIRSGEQYLGYSIGIEAGAVGENRVQEYAITFTNDKVSLAYQIPAYRLFRVNLDGKWHVFNTNTEMTLDKKISPVIVSQNRIVSVRLKPVLEAQSRFVAPILKEVHTTPSAPQGGMTYALDPTFDGMNGVYLTQVDGDQGAIAIKYAVYRFTDEKTAQEAKTQRYGNMHELLKRSRELLCSGSLTVDPAKVPDNKGVSTYQPKAVR